MSHASSQEVEIVVEGTITRLVPCGKHSAEAPGEMVLSDGSRLAVGEGVPEDAYVVQNPNGFHHECAECARTPTQQEALERTVTRHVL